MFVGVLTADIIDSSALKSEELESLMHEIATAFQDFSVQNSVEKKWFDRYRGDSFQGVVYPPTKAFALALGLKTVIKKASLTEKTSNKAMKNHLDFRLCIGVGEIPHFPAERIATHGDTYVLSGRGLDGMKKAGQKMLLRSNNEPLNEEFAVHFSFLDQLTDKWSVASAEVVYWLLHGWKEVEIAEKLGISQAAVNARKKASGWEILTKLNERYISAITCVQHKG